MKKKSCNENIITSFLNVVKLKYMRKKRTNKIQSTNIQRQVILQEYLQ